MSSKLLKILFFTAIFIFFTRPLSGDGDFFHHASIGKYIVQYHTIPHLDSFTYTAAGKAFIGHSWATGVLYHVLYSLGGPESIGILSGFVGLLTFLLLYFWLKAYHIPDRIGFIVVTLTAATVSTRWPDRPEIMKYPILIAIFLLDMLRHKIPKIVVLFPFLILLWANFYGASVFLGLLILFLLAVRQLYHDGFRIVKSQRLFYLCILISFPLSLLNGYGLQTIFYFSRIRDIARVVGEWDGIFQIFAAAPVDYILVFQYRVARFFIYIVLVVFFMIVSRKHLRKYPLPILLSLSLFVPFFAARYMPLAYILSTPLLAILIDLQKGFMRKVSIGLVSGLTFLAVILGIWLNQPGLGLDHETFPKHLVQFMKEENLTGRTFNSQELGGFLTYNLYPNVLVMIDTRDDLFLHTQIYEDEQRRFSQDIAILPRLSRYKVDMVVADLSEGYFYEPLFYADNWSLVFLDSQYALFIKKAVSQEKNIPVYDALDPFLMTGTKKGKEEEAAIQYKKILLQNGPSYYNTTRYAVSLIDIGKLDEGVTLLENIPLKISPKQVLFVHDRDYLLFQIFIAKKNCSKAKLYLDKAKRDSEGKFIFAPFTKVSTLSDQGYALYYKECPGLFLPGSF